MYTASSFTVPLLFHDGLRCTALLGTCKTRPGEVPCSTVGQEGSRVSFSSRHVWLAGKWRIGACCLLIPRLKRMKPMQALNKKHSVKDSHVDKCHILILQSDFSLLLGNKKKCFGLYHKVQIFCSIFEQHNST